jgi:hypothetical protein
LDSVALVNAEQLTEHTFFQAQVAGSAINLSNGPWVAASAVWAHGSDCTCGRRPEPVEIQSE